MKTIKINNKEYPFVVSAANARMNAELSQKAEQEVSVGDMIDQYTKLVHMGLKDGRLAQPFFKRFYTIPSLQRLEHLIPFDEMVSMITQSGLPKQEEGDEKKH